MHILDVVQSLSDGAAAGMQTRGKGFRHEKTKKKRGSYRGGKIDTNATFSIKFESEDYE